MSDKLNFV